MNTLILNGTAKDLKLLLDISKKIGIDLKVVKEKTALASPEVVDEDEDGIPVKYRKEIMALSKKANKSIRKRWEADLAKKGVL